MDTERKVWKNMRRKSLYNKEDTIGFMYRREDEEEDENISVPIVENLASERMEITPVLDNGPSPPFEPMEAVNNISTAERNHIQSNNISTAERGHSNVELSSDEAPMEDGIDFTLDEEELRQQAYANLQFNRFLIDICKYLRQNGDVETAESIENSLETIVSEDGQMFKEALEDKVVLPHPLPDKVLSCRQFQGKKIDRYQAEIKEWDELMKSSPLSALPETINDIHQHLSEEQLLILQQCDSSDGDTFIAEARARLEALDDRLDQQLIDLQSERDRLIHQIETYKNQNILPALHIPETPRTLVRDIISKATTTIETPQ